MCVGGVTSPPTLGNGGLLLLTCSKVMIEYIYYSVKNISFITEVKK